METPESSALQAMLLLPVFFFLFSFVFVTPPCLSSRIKFETKVEMKRCDSVQTAALTRHRNGQNGRENVAMHKV